MKRGIFALLLLIIFSSKAFSEDNSTHHVDIAKRWAVGYRYGYVDADDADFRTSTGNRNRGCQNLLVSYGINNNLTIEFEGSFFKLISMDSSELNTYSILANLQLRKKVGDFYPYLVGGVGGQFFDYKDLGGTDAKDKDASIAYKFGGGLEYFLNNNWSLNAEGAYIYGNTGGSATLDTYSWHYKTGIKYYF